MFPWETLAPFQRLLVVRVLRPDALCAAVRVFVQQLMGDKFVSGGHIDLQQMYEASAATTPLIFILSSGTWEATAL